MFLFDWPHQGMKAMPRRKTCSTCCRKVLLQAAAKDNICPICGGEFERANPLPALWVPDDPESQYWLMLEFRLCSELARIPGLGHFWCDGFEEKQYLLNQPSPRITGRVWIANDWGPTSMEQWEFTLVLNRPVSSRSEIDWPSLLPPDNVTRWLAVDLVGKRLEIEPSLAVPNLA